MKTPNLVSLFLRLSIASVFLYASVAATLQPYNWVGFLPQFATTIIPASVLLPLFSLYQLVLAVWILAGWKTFYAGLLSCLTLLGIIVANWGDIDILFRDFAILFASLALAAYYYSPKKKK